MKGGKREGAGRPNIGPQKIKVAYSLARDVVMYLRGIKNRSQAQVIEEALREHKENHNND